MSLGINPGYKTEYTILHWINVSTTITKNGQCFFQKRCLQAVLGVTGGPINGAMSLIFDREIFEKLI